MWREMSSGDKSCWVMVSSNYTLNISVISSTFLARLTLMHIGIVMFSYIGVLTLSTVFTTWIVMENSCVSTASVSKLMGLVGHICLLPKHYVWLKLWMASKYLAALKLKIWWEIDLWTFEEWKKPHEMSSILWWLQMNQITSWLWQIWIHHSSYSKCQHHWAMQLLYFYSPPGSLAKIDTSLIYFSSDLLSIFSMS